MVRGARWALFANAIALNGFFLWILDDPDGLLGPSGAGTTFDLAAVGGLAAAVGLGVLLAWRGRAAGAALLLVCWVAATGLFLAVLPGNWSLALPLALYDTWLAWTVARHAWSSPRDIPLRHWRQEDAAREAPGGRLGALRRPALWTSAHAVALAVLVVGYQVTADRWAVLHALALAVPALALSVAAELGPRWRQGWRGPWLEWVLLLPLPWALLDPRRLLVLIALRQGVYLARWAWQSRESRAVLAWLFAWPARLFAVSFLLLIMAGGVLFSLPVAAAGERALAGVDALFLAVSAVCVTGLSTIDTATQLSGFGQVVLVTLFQVGGLGVMTLSTFAAIILGRRLGFIEESALGEMIDERRPRGVYRLVRFVVLMTLAAEAVGAALLLLWQLLEGAPIGPAAAFAGFHAVSAFCNAGFSLQTDSLVGWQESPLVLGTIAALVVLGGLGFAVVQAVVQRLRGGRPRRLPLQARLALGGTAVLLVGGAVAVAIVEWNNTLGDLPAWGRVLNAGFLSVTARTAGFNSVDTGALAPATQAIVEALMFVGACPGSTAGGIKVTTAIVLALSIRAMLRGSTEAEVGDRRIPPEIVLRATAIAALSVATIVVVVVLLLATQDEPVPDLVFEALSAFGTVGLSRGATPLLDPLGKSLVMLLMFVGRVGPLTLALAIRPREAPRYRAPTEHVMVG